MDTFLIVERPGSNLTSSAVYHVRRASLQTTLGAPLALWASKTFLSISGANSVMMNALSKLIRSPTLLNVTIAMQPSAWNVLGQIEVSVSHVIKIMLYLRGLALD
jgi:hypothetical protein